MLLGVYYLKYWLIFASYRPSNFLLMTDFLGSFLVTGVEIIVDNSLLE